MTDTTTPDPAPELIIELEGAAGVVRERAAQDGRPVEQIAEDARDAAAERDETTYLVRAIYEEEVDRGE